MFFVRQMKQNALKSASVFYNCTIFGSNHIKQVFIQFRNNK